MSTFLLIKPQLDRVTLQQIVDQATQGKYQGSNDVATLAQLFEPVSDGVDSRNVCVFAEGEVDRSPTGSGVSARVAIHHQRGELAIGETMKFESIIGSIFDCKINKTVTYEGLNAVIPEVSGTAHVTGKSEFVINPKDPLKHGFILR